MKYVGTLGLVGVGIVGAAAALASCKSNVISSSTAQGQTIDGPSGSGVSASFPAGAIPNGVTPTITEAAAGSYPAAPSGTTFMSKVYAFQPHGQTFNSPVTVTFPLPSGATCATVTAVSASSPLIWQAELNGAWSMSSASSQPPFGCTSSGITASVNAFSFFAVAGYQCTSADGGVDLCAGPGGPDASGGPGGPDSGSPSASTICQESGKTPSTTLATPGTGSLSSTGDSGGANYFTYNNTRVNLAQLTYVCGISANSGQTLYVDFTSSPDFCANAAGGVVKTSETAFQVQFNPWQQKSSGETQPGVQAGFDVYTGASQANPMCNENPVVTQGTGTSLDGSQVAMTVTTAQPSSGQTVSGSVSFTTPSGTTVTGTFSNAPTFIQQATTGPNAAYCCE